MRIILCYSGESYAIILITGNFNGTVERKFNWMLQRERRQGKLNSRDVAWLMNERLFEWFFYSRLEDFGSLTNATQKQWWRNFVKNSFCYIWRPLEPVPETKLLHNDWSILCLQKNMFSRSLKPTLMLVLKQWNVGSASRTVAKKQPECYSGVGLSCFHQYR